MGNVSIIRYDDARFDKTAVAKLFQDYYVSLETDENFFDVNAEIMNMPGKYHASQNGEMYLAELDGQFVGCAAIYDMGNNRAELKRLYVAPEARGYQIGKRLIDAAIYDAHKNGYHWLLLDSWRRLKSAGELYKKMGFVHIPPYNNNPERDAYWMAYDLLNGNS